METWVESVTVQSQDGPWGPEGRAWGWEARTRGSKLYLFYFTSLIIIKRIDPEDLEASADAGKPRNPQRFSEGTTFLSVDGGGMRAQFLFGY